MRVKNPLAMLGAVFNRAPAPLTMSSSGPASLWSPRTTNSSDPLELYGSNSTLFPIVNKNANKTASIEWHMHRTKNLRSRTACDVCGEEGAVNVPDHLALRIWNRPNPFYNRQEFVESLQQHVDLCGESFWMVEYWEGTSLPKHLWLRWPHQMREVPDPDEFLLGWWTTGINGTKVPLGLDEVIQVKMPNPANPYRGLGPVQAALVHLGFARQATEWNSAFFRNSARPDGVLTMEDLTPTELKLARAEWNTSYSGVSNAHRVAVVNKKQTWSPMSYTHDDMQFEQLLRLSEEFTRKAFNFPKFFLGEPEDSNRAASEAAQDFYNEELIVPRLERIKGVLNDDFLKLFGSTGQDVQFVYRTPVVGNVELRNATRESSARTFQTLVSAGVDPADAAWQAGLPQLRMASEEVIAQ